MKHLGIEIEFTGVSRKEVCSALENLFETEAKVSVGSVYDIPYEKYSIMDKDGYKWRLVRDRSVVSVPEDTTENCCELVSPVLSPQTLPTLFTVVDIIKSLGGVVNETCGIHIHIDRPTNFSDTLNLLRKFIYSQDETLKFYGVEGYRLEKYCKAYTDFPMDVDFASEEELLNFLYEKYLEDGDEKRKIRYFALNLYSLVTHNTLEFRLFNSSLDKVQIAKYIDWVLHFCYAVDDFDDYILELGKILYGVV